MLDQLILDGAVRAHLARRRISAVEAHEGIGQIIVVLALDALVIHALRYGVVDVEQRHRILRYAGSDVFRKSSVDVYFAGYRDAAARESRVNVARLESERLRECRPALVGECYILARTFVLIGPVEQCQLELRHSLEHLRIISAFSHLCLHVFADLRDPCVSCMLLVAYEEVKF